MSLVYLVGTVHWDIKGPERLRKFLDFARPSTICLEYSEELVEQKLKDRELIIEKIKEIEALDNAMMKLSNALNLQSEKPEDDFTLKFLEIQGYEVWTSYEYKRENPDSVIYPIHDHKFLVEEGTRIYRKGFGESRIDDEGNFTEEFVNGVGDSDKDKFQEWVDEVYFTDESAIHEISELMPVIREADNIMEPKIREVIGNGFDGTAAIIAGNKHFFGGYGNNLYDRLQDFSPNRIMLPDVDKF